MVLGQYNLVLLVLSGTGLVQGFMSVYIDKSGDLVGCYHSGMDRRTDIRTDRWADAMTNNKQGNIDLLSQWTTDGGDE